MIVTFYSYKGGTGRTMALANIASLLATRGHKVLMIDFDLEAPGLVKYFARFHPDLDQQEGLIDLLTIAASAASSSTIDWRDYIAEMSLDSTVRISILTSGRLDSKYASKVLGFDWSNFFRNSNGAEFIEQMRLQWNAEYDYVLIDSRTGVTDTGGICTIMLPDMIALIFVSNLQSIEGAIDIVKRAQAARRSFEYDRAPAAILPILSRFDNRTEFESAEEWLQIAASYMRPLYANWLPANYAVRDALDHTKLPYVAYFSFGEKIPVLTHGISSPDSLGYALNTVAQLIEGQLQNAHIVIGATTSSHAPNTPPTPVARNADKRDSNAVVPDVEKFYGREYELENITKNLASPVGPHLWLVVSPPQMGKSRLLHQISTSVVFSDWLIECVDLCSENYDLSTDGDAVVRRIFRLNSADGDWPTTRLTIARKVASSRQSHLLLLDGAERLNSNAVSVVRSRLADISTLIRDGYNDIRVALIVASRREEGWMSLARDQQLAVLRLSELPIDAIRSALADLAENTGSGSFAPDVPAIAQLVFDLTEGLPALVNQTLRWIQDEEWLSLERLKSDEVFSAIAGDYIKETLLSVDSLTAASPKISASNASSPDRLKTLLEMTLEAVARYRLFTKSHLRYHLERDGELRGASDYLGWSVDDLWEAVGETAFLAQPLDEPWQALPRPIRSLLFRYFYEPSRRSVAHLSAISFIELWSDQQVGKEQAIALVEHLWHWAMAQEPDGGDLPRPLIALAVTLADGLKPSRAYTVEELRRYAAERIENDFELQGTLPPSSDLVANLIEVVKNSGRA